MPSRPIDGGTSYRQSVESFERLKPRLSDKDLPPIPDLDRGTPGSVLDPVIVHEVEVIPARPVPTVTDQVRDLGKQMLRETGELAPGHSDFPQWKGLSEWKPERD